MILCSSNFLNVTRECLSGREWSRVEFGGCTFQSLEATPLIILWINFAIPVLPQNIEVVTNQVSSVSVACCSVVVVVLLLILLFCCCCSVVDVIVVDVIVLLLLMLLFCCYYSVAVVVLLLLLLSL